MREFLGEEWEEGLRWPLEMLDLKAKALQPSSPFQWYESEVPRKNVHDGQKSKVESEWKPPQYLF